MGKLDGKVAIITGTASGIGKASAILFAAEGAAVSICDIVEDKLQQTANEIISNKGRVLAKKCDLSQFEEIKAFVEATVSEFGTVDILVNNAANFGYGGIMETEQETWDTSFAINLGAPRHLMRLCFPYMQMHGGKIINVISRGALQGVAGLASYDASKGALLSLSLEAAREWAEYNINVNLVMPECLSENTMEIVKQIDPGDDWPTTLQSLGPFFEKPPLGWERFFPKYVAPALVFLASEDAQWMTGNILKVDGGIDIHI
jgi:NAD(P)-dependent dehydrogenase (short-subunit alcohol dehydrogenase family)